MAKPTQFTIDKTVYQIGYNFNDMVDAESVTGVNLLAAMGKMASDLTAGELRALLYAMIAPSAGAPKDPVELLKFCGSLLRVDTISLVRYAITEAFARAISDEFGDHVRDELREPTGAAPAPAPAPAHAPGPVLAE